MAQRIYAYPCCGTSGGGSPTCSTHDVPGVFDHWWIGMYGAMQRYMQRTRLAPMGPHRQLADQLLGPLWQQCGLCDGCELVGSESADQPIECPACEGVGGYWISEELVAAARAQVIAAFPEAGPFCVPKSGSEGA